MANMENQNTSGNPRLNLLRREVEQRVLKPFRSHVGQQTLCVKSIMTIASKSPQTRGL